MWDRLRNLGLRPKIAASIIAVGVVVLFSTVAYVGFQARSLALKDAQEKTIQITNRWATEVQSEMQVAMDCNRTLAQAMEGMKNRGVPPRDMMDGILKNILERSK